MEKSDRNKILSAVAGILAGAVNGLFGGGGGMLVVPALALLGGDGKRAHATAIAVILPLAVVSGLFYAGYGSFDLSVGIPAAVGVTVGGICGALLLKKIRSDVLPLIFSVVMLAAGLRLVLG